MTWNCTQFYFWSTASAGTSCAVHLPHRLTVCSQRSLQLSLELSPCSRFPTSAFVHECICLHGVWYCIFETQTVLRECSLSLWLNNALCICDQVIYMRCDQAPPSRRPGHHQPARDPASALFPRALCTTLPPTSHTRVCISASSEDLSVDKVVL